MKDCLVTVANTERGSRLEWRGLLEPVLGMYDLGETIDGGWEDEIGYLRNLKMWSCTKRDVPALVDKLSAQWIGHEVKVYQLTEVHTRTVGELRSKEVSKDGILPAGVF